MSAEHKSVHALRCADVGEAPGPECMGNHPSMDAARMFSAGLDRARGEPYQWGGGMSGYGRRYAARYGEFVAQNSFVAGGNALLGYEPRYDFCRCRGISPRTLHAISRNFVAYNRTERELRRQIPDICQGVWRWCALQLLAAGTI